MLLKGLKGFKMKLGEVAIRAERMKCHSYKDKSFIYSIFYKLEMFLNNQENEYLHGVPKKMSFLGKTAITTFKIIQNAKVWGVLENSGYLLPDEH